jgi:hypothetical protein
MKTNNTTQPLLDFYEAILKLGAFTVGDDGLVSSTLSGEKTPANIKVDGHPKRLCLPTDAILKSNQWDNLIAFHPLNENLFLARGESRVIEYLRKAFNYRMNVVLHLLFREALVLASSPALHKSVNSTQMGLLTALKDADEKTLSNWERIADTLSVTNTRDNIASLYLKKQGNVGDVKYARIGVWSFPLYEALTKSQGEVQGVKVRKKDLEVFKRLYEYIIPSLHDPLYYQVGSNSTSAPYLDALLKVMWKLAEPVNAYTDTMFGGKTYLPEKDRKDIHEYAYFSNDWLSASGDLSQFEKYVRLIPIQDGVEKQPPTAPVTQVVSTPASSPLARAQQQAQAIQTQPVQTNPVVQQPVNVAAQAQPAQTAPTQKRKGAVTLDEIAAYQREQIQNQVALAAAANPFANPQALAQQQIMSSPLVNPLAAANSLGMLPQVMQQQYGVSMQPMMQTEARQGKLLNQQVAQAAAMGYVMQPQVPVAPQPVIWNGQMPMQPVGAPMMMPGMQPMMPAGVYPQQQPVGYMPTINV